MPPNSALLSDAHTSLLRAQPIAAKRERLVARCTRTATYGPERIFNSANRGRSVLGFMTMTTLKAFVATFAVFLSLTGAAQAQVSVPEPTQDPLAPYRLFRTQNIYMFLLLDTRTGQISQVQWNPQIDSRFASSLNPKPLALDGKAGRFTLYPTQNIYTFLLLDQYSGNTWQVQWGKDRLIVPIE